MRRFDLSLLKGTPPGAFHPHQKPGSLAGLTTSGGAKTWKIGERVATASYPVVRNGELIEWSSLKVLVTVPVFNSDIVPMRMFKLLFMRYPEEEDESEKRRKRAVYRRTKTIVFRAYGFLGQEVCLAMLQNSGEKELKGAYGVRKTPDLESKNFIYEVKTSGGKKIKFKKSQIKKNLACAQEKKKRLKILILVLSPYKNKSFSFIVKDIFYAPSGSFMLHHPKRKGSKTTTYSLSELRKLGSSFWFEPIKNLKTP